MVEVSLRGLAIRINKRAEIYEKKGFKPLPKAQCIPVAVALREVAQQIEDMLADAGGLPYG